MEQVLTPNPNVACTPGMCLEYVQDTFGLTPVDPTAISAWDNSTYQHKDQNWPALWFPIFFTVKGVPAGHVALHAPDHSIYSSSSPTAKTAVHHPSLAAMQQYWGNGTMLTYLGWTEDVENVSVIKNEGNNMNKDQATELSLYARLLDFESVDEANSHREDDVNHILADPGYAGALLKQIYQGGNWQLINEIVVNAKNSSGKLTKQAVIDYLTKNLN